MAMGPQEYLQAATTLFCNTAEQFGHKKDLAHAYFCLRLAADSAHRAEDLMRHQAIIRNIGHLLRYVPQNEREYIDNAYDRVKGNVRDMVFESDLIGNVYRDGFVNVVCDSLCKKVPSVVKKARPKQSDQSYDNPFDQIRLDDILQKTATLNDFR
jgi:translation elongation factor EF-G